MLHNLFLGAGELAQSCAALSPLSALLARRAPKNVPWTRSCALNFNDEAALQRVLFAERPAWIVLCATPDQRDEAAYRQTYLQPITRLMQIRAATRAKFRILFCASTAVYGQNAGEWVGETDLAEPLAYNGRVLRETEQLLQGQDLSLRFSGLYRPKLSEHQWSSRDGALALLEQPVAASPRLAELPGQSFSNRVHLFDAARALLHLQDVHAAGQIIDEAEAQVFNVSDLRPSSGFELQKALFGLEPPARISAPNGKRVSVQKLQQTGFQWRFPSYLAGYLRAGA